jgi:hypothetical protein
MGWFGTLLTLSAIGNHWQNSLPDTDVMRKSTPAVGTVPPAAFQQPNMAAAPVPYTQPIQTSPYPGQAYPPSSPPQGHTPGTVPV